MNGKCSRIKGSCYYVGNIACDISGVSTKAPYEATLMSERHVRKGITGFVMRTFASEPSLPEVCALTDVVEDGCYHKIRKM